MVRRGEAKDTLADSSAKNVKTFNKAMDKLFKNFPPQKIATARRWELLNVKPHL